MTRLKYLISFIFIIIFSSCIETEVLKTIKWNGNAIRLTVTNGGATTAFLYKVDYKKNWFFARERLIFESYSSPSLEDILVENDKLFIVCFTGNSQVNKIEIDLKNINKFIRNPIEYRRDELIRSNGFYIEPDFIKRDRHFNKRMGL